jgi:hypothetical protein
VLARFHKSEKNKHVEKNATTSKFGKFLPIKMYHFGLPTSFSMSKMCQNGFLFRYLGKKSYGHFFLPHKMRLYTKKRQKIRNEE